jgi:predicted DNA-binding transcriptional regulator YafY
VPVPRVIVEALAAQRVIKMEYCDRHGVPTSREVEPMGYIGGIDHWYLLAWCRWRDAVRAFRLDRIASAVATDEVVTPRPLSAADLDIPALMVTQVTVTSSENTDRTLSRPALRLVPSPADGAGATRGDRHVRDDKRHRLVRNRH